MATALRQRIERRGLALPALRTRGGYFASKSSHDTAWGDLLLAIFCPIGGRFMNRGFGSGLDKVLMEPNLTDLADQAEYIIRDTAQKWVPHVIIDRVDATRREKTMYFKVHFHLIDDTTVEARLVELPRDGIVRLLGVQRIQG